MQQYTSNQKKVINGIDRSISVIAGAGSGKTRVLIGRCQKILQSHDTDISGILAITFTEKASAELKSRLIDVLPHPAEIANAYVHTFHGFCARILKENAVLLNIKPDFGIWDKKESDLVIRSTVNQTLSDMMDANDKLAQTTITDLGFHKTINIIEELINYRWHANNLDRHISLSDNVNEIDKIETNLISNIFKLFDIVLGKYSQEKQSNHSFDFNDLEIKALELLENNPDVLKQYQKKFRHILVDEYQDTNDVQARLIELLYNTKVNKLCIVGDPKQSIYYFRGANIECFNKTSQLITKNNGEIIKLDTNFRSTPAIINFTNNTFSSIFSSSCLDPDYEEMLPFRDGAGKSPIETIFLKCSDKASTYERRNLESQWIAKKISTLVESEGKRYGDIACLFQSFSDIKTYEANLLKARIPYNIHGGRGYLGRQEVLDIVNFLRVIYNPNDKLALFGVLRSPLIGLSDDKCYELFKKTDGLTHFINEADAALPIKKLLELNSLLTTSELITEIIKLTNLDHIYLAIDPSGQSLSNIEKLVSICTELERDKKIELKDFLKYVRDLKERGAQIDPVTSAGGNSVSLLTIHAAKGLEFDTVILPDLIRQTQGNKSGFIFIRNKGISLKSEDVTSQRFEEYKEIDKDYLNAEKKRLLYVACTRARNKLIIPFHHSYYRGNFSRWLKEFYFDKYHPDIKLIGPENVLINSLHESLPIQKQSTVNKLCYGGQEFNVTQLETFESCPYKYQLKYHYGIPSGTLKVPDRNYLPANIRGDIIHTILEKTSLKDIASLRDILKKTCLAKEIYPKESYINEMFPILDRYFNSFDARLFDDSLRELPFLLKVNDHTVSGVIDRLVINSNTYKIVDFKTDKISHSSEIEKHVKQYELQMKIYALSVRKSFNPKSLSASLYFLDINEEVPIDVCESSCNKTETHINDLIVQILESSETEKNRASCSKCPYRLNEICK